MTKRKLTTVRLIYIHGFQGDHTSFQAIPTDLHQHLRPRLSPGIALESCLYPTYKSRRSVSEAANKFIEWLGTQPPGPVILLAHSMGGLLAAEVATGNSEPAKRVIGLVAFDVPFLGMHPHVIISGIASLLPKDKEKNMKTEDELNDQNIVKQVVGDDVDSGTGSSVDGSSSDTTVSHALRTPLYHSSSSFGSQVSDEWEAMKSKLTPPGNHAQRKSLSPAKSRSAPSSPHSSTQSLVSSFSSTSSSYIFSRIPPLPSPLMAKLESAVDRLSQHADSPLIRWLRKHSDDPLNAMTRWIVEHFEFGICMFDPAGLSERYRALEGWNGKWVNYWTEVPACGISEESADKEEDEGDGAAESKGALPTNTADLASLADDDEHSSAAETRDQAKARKTEGKALRKQRAKERKQGDTAVRPARHFIVLPHKQNGTSDKVHFGSRERWECVPIRGVDDEVGAHCGLFIRDHNPDYDKLVERVSDDIRGWLDQ